MHSNTIDAGRNPRLTARHADRPHADQHRHQRLPERKAAGDDQLTLNQDQLSLNQDDVPQGAAESRSLAVSRFKAQLRIRQTDDGATELKLKSQLKFSYEFQSDDGTTIKLSAKVKSNISYKQTGEDSFELKSRVKIQLSAVQKTVQSGLAPVLASDQVGDQQSSAISAALQDFGDLVDRVTSQFLDNSLFGDDLIAGIVNAFNDLSQAVQSELPADAAPSVAPAEQPALEQSTEVVDAATPQVAVADQNAPVAEEVVANAEQPIEQPVGDVAEPSDGQAATRRHR